MFSICSKWISCLQQHAVQHLNAGRPPDRHSPLDRQHKAAAAAGPGLQGDWEDSSIRVGQLLHRRSSLTMMQASPGCSPWMHTVNTHRQQRGSSTTTSSSSSICTSRQHFWKSAYSSPSQRVSSWPLLQQQGSASSEPRRSKIVLQGGARSPPTLRREPCTSWPRQHSRPAAAARAAVLRSGARTSLFQQAGANSSTPVAVLRRLGACCAPSGRSCT